MIALALVWVTVVSVEVLLIFAAPPTTVPPVGNASAKAGVRAIAVVASKSLFILTLNMETPCYMLTYG
jgi:hypothetical protein